MNRIFRVIWSQATQSWVAVSELTKAHKKQSSTNQTSVLDTHAGAAGIFKLSLLTLSLMLGNSAFAAYSAGNNAQATGDNSTAIGDGAKAVSSQGISIGRNAGIDSTTHTSGHNNIVIGSHSRVGWNGNAAANTSGGGEVGPTPARGDNVMLEFLNLSQLAREMPVTKGRGRKATNRSLLVRTRTPVVTLLLRLVVMM